MTDCIRLNAIITIIMITFFFKFFLNHCCQSLKLYRYIYYLYYFGKYMIIYSLYQNEQVICLIRTVLFYLSAQVLYSSVLLSMAVSISSSIQKLAKFRCHDQSWAKQMENGTICSREKGIKFRMCAIYLNQGGRAYLFRVYGYTRDEETRLSFFIHRLSSREETWAKRWRNRLKDFIGKHARNQVFRVFFLHIKCAPVFIAIFVPRYLYTRSINYYTAFTRGKCSFSVYKLVLQIHPAFISPYILNYEIITPLRIIRRVFRGKILVECDGKLFYRYYRI